MRVSRTSVNASTEAAISKISSRKIINWTFNFCIREMWTFSSFVNVLGAGPRPKPGKKTDKLDLSTWNSQISGILDLAVLKNMHLLSRSCTCSPLWEVFPSREKDPPFWNGYKECVFSISLGLSQGDDRSPFFGLWILNLETNFSCWVGLILLHLSSIFLEFPGPLWQSPPDLLKLS